MDKYGHLVEVGSVTLGPQGGNHFTPRSRVTRIDEETLINCLGCPSDPAHKVFRRLGGVVAAGRTNGVPVGVSLVPNQGDFDPISSYCALVEQAATFRTDGIDFVTLNVSTPNTRGVQAFQEPRGLSLLLRAVELTQEPRPPVLVKVGPDADVAGVCAVLRDSCAVGLVAVNTTPTPSGGLSGKLVAKEALRFVEAAVKELRGELSVVASGGVMTGADVVRRLNAGASLVQVCTGFLLRGARVFDEAEELTK